LVSSCWRRPSPICAREQVGVALDDARRVYARLVRRFADQIPDAAKSPAAAAGVGAGRASLQASHPTTFFVAADNAWRTADPARRLREHACARPMATFRAGLAGANAITVLHHTLALRPAPTIDTRAARNTPSCCSRNPTGESIPTPQRARAH